MENEGIICGYPTLINWDKTDTLKEVSMFVSTKLSTLEAVAGTATHFVLKKYKDHGMILIDKEPANRMKVTP